jgi:ABC-type transporter Mla maintaining outer membrane lipid asymmetry ATPase subunit MlaF
VHNDNLVEIEDVAFGYGARPVLKGINLTARRGRSSPSWAAAVAAKPPSCV